MSIADWLAAGFVLLGVWAYGLGVNSRLPGLGLIKLLGLIAAGFLVYRIWARWRRKLLWSLRNRLILAYVLIAVVPVLLLAILAARTAEIIYSQFGAYLVYHDLRDRVNMIELSAEHMSAEMARWPAQLDENILVEVMATQLKASRERELPGLKMNLEVDEEYFRRLVGPNGNSYAGFLQRGNQLFLVAVHSAETPRGKRRIELSAPVTPDFLEDIAANLGPLDVTLWQRVSNGSDRSTVRIGNRDYRTIGKVSRKKLLPSPAWWGDPVVDGFTQIEAASVLQDGSVEKGHPVFAFFKTRNSQLNHLIFTSLGDLSNAQMSWLAVVSLFFLLIEITALVIGVLVTRAITQTISELYKATQFVQQGNFSHRVKVERHDQLGELGESFNTMTTSITRLVEEQKQLQRLENEIGIASEVQNQLFPRGLPHVEGVEVEAICRAARTVSGDYYDFIPLGDAHVAFAIADISGKGISAALLMASLQAALRSQLLTPGSESMSTAELVARLNKHLVRNTGDDRFATFFVAIYNTKTRELRYTNAGHLPGFLLSEGKSTFLHEGGIVLGILDDYPYEEGVAHVPPDAVLIGYSDGLIEPENAYGEQFGIPRLESEAHRIRHAAPRKIAESLMRATEEWAGSPEQADDMTIIVAKLK